MLIKVKSLINVHINIWIMIGYQDFLTTVKSITGLCIDPIGHGEVITTNVEVCYVMSCHPKACVSKTSDIGTEQLNFLTFITWISFPLFHLKVKLFQQHFSIYTSLAFNSNRKILTNVI